mgnify:CR=1 FL=1
MPVSRIHIEEFLALSGRMPLLDVRSPGEFTQAHIPGAVSLPLFSDEERKIIGTAYKQESREKAIKIGLDAFGKKMVSLVEQAEKICNGRPDKSREICLHCWRGGMRSGAVAWLLDLYGFKVYLLAGGYKSYRHWVISHFEKPWPLLLVGGYTGGNKTGVITHLKKLNHQVVDLEDLAIHKGSAFGNLEYTPQPSQEMFENLLAAELHRFGNSTAPIWVEAESQRLGYVNIPQGFFNTMRLCPLFFLDIPFEQRLQHIVAGYGKYEKDRIVSGILRIKKRLGGLETKTAIKCLL